MNTKQLGTWRRLFWLLLGVCYGWLIRDALEPLDKRPIHLREVPPPDSVLRDTFPPAADAD